MAPAVADTGAGYSALRVYNASVDFNIAGIIRGIAIADARAEIASDCRDGTAVDDDFHTCAVPAR